MDTKLNVGIVGYGRFGEAWAKILADDFNINILVKPGQLAGYTNEKVHFTENIAEFYLENSTIFIAVPIAAFANVIQDHAKFMRPGQLIVDVLSVKMHPKGVFEKLLPSGVEAMLTHPMFGPDSIRMAGVAGQPIVIDKFRTSTENYTFWKDYFLSKGLKVLEMTAKEHDQLAAKSHGVTHFIGRLLQTYGLQPTPIDTLGAKKLYEIMDQTCNDTWDLFLGLQNYNPYTKGMRLAIGHAYDKVYDSLLSEQIEPGVVHIGIQGGPGSFNEQALNDYVARHGIIKYHAHYLYTTEKVMRELHYGNIDLGLFAIHNSVGGIVNESIQAIAKYKFKIVEEFAIKIRHMLMHHPDVDPNSIRIVMAHDQVLKQCKKTLAARYANLTQVIGKGDLIDTATAARAMAQGQISNDRFILGQELIAELYDLKIIDRDLQDDPDNLTSFMLVSRL